MDSFADSNSIPIGELGNTLSTAISIHDSSNDSPPNHGPLRFQVRLYENYLQEAVFPEVEGITGTDRWLTINTQYDRSYKVELIDDGAGFSLQRGWPVLARVENLQEGQILMFEKQDEDTFMVWVQTPAQRPPPTGFSPGRILFANSIFGPSHLIINPGTKMNETVLQAIQQVWTASSVNGPVYVCCLLIIPAGNNKLVFHESYSELIPKNKTNIAMRFIGSNLIIPGGIKTYSNGSSRMVKWSLYAKEHNLTSGEIFICKIHRGPAITEFIGFCAGRN